MPVSCPPQDQSAIALWQHNEADELGSAPLTPVCDEVRSLYTKFACNILLAGALETIEKVTSTRVAETCFTERFNHLCNLQSACNSPRP